jgi:hypothetical protein
MVEEEREFMVEVVFSDLGKNNSMGIEVCSHTKLMQNKNWGNKDKEKEENNRTNPTTLRITT